MITATTTVPQLTITEQLKLASNIDSATSRANYECESEDRLPSPAETEKLLRQNALKEISKPEVRASAPISDLLDWLREMSSLDRLDYARVYRDGQLKTLIGDVARTLNKKAIEASKSLVA